MDKNDITIIVHTYNRPSMCAIAVRSAMDQTQPCRVMVANDGAPLPKDCYLGACYLCSGRPGHPYLSIYDAVYMANTPYVVVLNDDDWLEPAFVEECMKLMSDDVAYVFTESTIHHQDGTKQLHWNSDMQTGVYATSKMANKMFLRKPRIVSSSTAVHRREAYMACFAPGGIPGIRNRMPGHPNPSGPDALMQYMPLLMYDEVGYVSKPLSNLRAWSESTTIKELSNDRMSFQRNYLDVMFMYEVFRDMKEKGIL